MITKAIVEEIDNRYSIRVRIPVFNQSKDSVSSTPTKDLPFATVCTLPNCDINFQPGDIVYVAFEDNNVSTPVIIGFLSKASETKSLANVTLDSATVNTHFELKNAESQFNNYSYTELATAIENTRMLMSYVEQLQSQVSELNTKIDRLSH